MPQETRDRQASRTYWLQVFTEQTWQEFLDAGGKTTGFRETRWGVVQRLKLGDYLLCYISGLGSWIAILEVESEPYLDTSRIWKEALYPCRTRVRIVVSLALNAAVPIRNLRAQLSIFRNKNWGLRLISSPLKWDAADADVVIGAVSRAAHQPSIESEPNMACMPSNPSDEL